MQIILNDQCDMGARQAGSSLAFLDKHNDDFFLRSGAIYLKNHINGCWSDGSSQHVSNDPDIQALADAVNVNIPQSTNDQSASVSLISQTDKEYLRNVLIDAIIRTKDPLR